MGSGPRNYTVLTIKRLYGLSGNQCSFPGCVKPLINEKNAKDGNICHIEGANPGSKRYRKGMSDKERADYNNLILLCVRHHDKTDCAEKYTVDVLKKMKSDHVSKQRHKGINNNPSMLRNAVNAIAKIDIQEDAEEETLNSFNISSKLEYNNVIRYVSLIQEYKVYHRKINSLYNDLERQGSLKKSKVLSAIRNYYLKAKGIYIHPSEGEMEQIKEHADDIIDKIVEDLYGELERGDLFNEDIMLGIDLIIVDAFMRCKILEEPK